MPLEAWRAGLLLAASTALLWATLPIAAKLALRGVDPFTLTWVRFVFAGAVTLAWLGARRQLGVFRRLDGRVAAWLVLASVALIANYVLYLVGLRLTTPGSAQLLIQGGPLFMGLGGLVFFGERFARVQWLGLAVLLVGMGLFFSDHLWTLVSGAQDYVMGAGVILLAAVAWAAYALIQKRLGGVLPGQAVLLAVYVVGSVVLVPTASPASLLGLGWTDGVAVLYCCLNTVLAYGAFAAAVQAWDSSRVSAVLTLTPLGTLLFVSLLASTGLGWVEHEAVTALGWLGAVGVVFGSMAISLGGRRRLPAIPAPGAATSREPAGR